jgi:Membrane-associated phospholipid phosphatase
MNILDYLWQFDSAILLWIQSLRQEWMNPFWKGVTFLGDAGWFWIVLALLLLCFRGTRKAGMAAFLALAVGALITNMILKPMFVRTRPYEVIDGLILLVEKQRDYSFPSGHSCASFAAATALWGRLSHRTGIILWVLAGLIAFSRLYVGVHYPSDVLGGIAIGVFAGCLAHRFKPLSSPA